MKPKTYLLLLFFAIFVGACINQKSEVSCESLLLDISSDSLNTVFRVDAPSHLNDFKIGDSLFIVVENNTDTAIEIAPDEDILGFWWQENSWTPLENKMNYLSVIHHLSQETDMDPGLGIYHLEYSFPKTNEPIRVCIVVEGIKDPDSSRSRVVANVELTLNP